jgi:hypothetical protein
MTNHELLIYVGDARNVVTRICNHCSNNVEASALRQRVATHVGYQFLKSRRPKGSTKIQLALPKPRAGEELITNYIRSGVWRFVVCESEVVAADFQWYAIDRLRPLLNLNRRQWKSEWTEHYSVLLQQLISCRTLEYREVRSAPKLPGVYALFHQRMPAAGGLNVAMRS